LEFVIPVFDPFKLPWLEPATPQTQELLADRERIKALDLKARAALAAQNLSNSGRRVLARSMTFDRDVAREHGLTPLRICVVSQTSSEFLMEELVVAGLRFGLVIDVVGTDFNQLADAAFGGYFNAAERKDIDFVFVGLDYRQLGFRADQVGNEDGATAELRAKLLLVRGIIEGIRSRAGVACIVQNLVPQPQDWISSIDAALPGTAAWYVDRFNRALAGEISNAGNIVFDANSIAADVGYSRWHAPGMWHLAKITPSPQAIPYCVHRLAALLAAARGRSKRVLVLDLDNTLWGGVIGDDGIGGIEIGQGSAVGEAFLNIQTLALALKARGVILAACSKNDDAIAKEPFGGHPGMALSLEDFAVFRANWEDKASNIRHIAKILNLGLDSIVFLDDNSAEREIVRRTLPEVAVPELGGDPAEYPRILAAADYFESITHSTEDGRRASMYAANAQRNAVMETVTDMNSYLSSLSMKLALRPFDAPGRARIAQLINKSNQFNLTTRRYSEPEIEALERDPSVLTLQASLHDRFGDNGMICVVICRAAGDAWEIDTWLMSCRVLKRRVEEQILEYLVDKARVAGVKHLVGVYRPTPRNGPVVDHYRNLGFEKGAAADDGAQTWRLEVDAHAHAGKTRAPLPFVLV
jgi:FkbH-like protein